MDPVLRWAGSKRKSLPLLQEFAPVRYTRYVEPFAGSAVLFFKLEKQTSIIGDLNPEVASTYRAIKKDHCLVADYLHGIPTTSDAYYRLRQINPEDLTEFQRAARLIYLMKACFNGVYRTNLKGRFNVPLGSRFYRLPSRDDLQAAARHLEHAEILNGDFELTLERCREGDFVYLDPPYSDSARFRGEYSYDGAFCQDDEDRLVVACRRLTEKRVKVLVSFKWKESLIASLSGWKLQHVKTPRSVAGFAAARVTANEMLCRNF